MNIQSRPSNASYLMILFAISIFMVSMAAGEFSATAFATAEPVKTGSVYVISSPSAASLYVDGFSVGVTPRTLAMREGMHAISVSKSGYEPIKRIIVVKSGVTQTLSVELAAA